MPNCAISSCKNSSRVKNKIIGGITYHQFPKEPDVKTKWIDATGRYDWFPTKYSCICSAHFTETDFIRSAKTTGRRHLFKDAVPTINLHPLLLSQANSDENGPGSSQDPIGVADPLCTLKKRKFHSRLDRAENVIKRQRLEIKRLQVRNRRLKKKITSMEDVINNIKEQSSMQDEQLAIIKSSGIQCREFVARQKLNMIMGRTVKVKYSPALRSFALTLHYYSPKAYRYVRQTFDTCLPHPRTLIKWYQSKRTIFKSAENGASKSASHTQT